MHTVKIFKSPWQRTGLLLVNSKASISIASSHNISEETLFSYECCQ